MKYCTYCGKQLNDDESCSCQSPQGTPGVAQPVTVKFPRLNVKKAAILAVVALAVLIAVISLISYAGSVIDLTDYIVIEGVAGLNGQGVLKYELDEDRLMMAIWGEVSNEEITEENFEAIMAENLEKLGELQNALRCITISADRESGLSNGDTVTVSAAFKNTESYRFSYHFKDGSQTYTVEGLQEGKTIDPFAAEYVTVTFSGISTKGTAELEVLADEEPVSLFFYRLSQGEDLSNGDTVTLTAEVNESDLMKLGYLMPTSLEKTYTVDGLEEGKAIDPFAEEYISLTFSGISGWGEATLEILAEDAPISLFRYKLSQTDDLENGDTITLTANVDEDDLLEIGYLMPEVLEKTYTVGGLGTFFDFTNGFPPEELASLCEKAMANTRADEQEAVQSGYSVTAPSALQAAYSLKAITPEEPYRDIWEGVRFENAVVVVTSYTYRFDEITAERTEWFLWLFPNFYLDADGILAYDAEQEYHKSLQRDSLAEVYNWILEEFKALDLMEIECSK